jgi:TolB protein
MALTLASNLAAAQNDAIDSVGAWNDHHVSWAPDGSYLAIDSDRTGGGEVFLIRPDGSEPRRITATPGDEVAPIWSPDSKWLAVQLVVDDQTDGWVMHSDGSAARRLSTGGIGAGRMSWAPDSKRIALTHYVDVEVPVIYSVDLDTDERSVLVENGIAPDWSPDGATLAFSRQHGELFSLY